MVGFQRFSQLRPGPTVKDSCICTGPAGRAGACELVSDLFLERRRSGSMSVRSGSSSRMSGDRHWDGLLDSDEGAGRVLLGAPDGDKLTCSARLRRVARRKEVVVEVALVEESDARR